MNSSIINVSEILNDAKNLFSAGFSAGYNFDEFNAAEYFDGMIENSLSPTPIFSGILIMVRSGNDLTIVDGLQRLTTISLLLSALCEIYKDTSEKNEEARTKVFERYLVNENEPKLKLTGEEYNIYKKILFSEKLNEYEVSSNLFKTYKSFLHKITEQKITGTQLFNVISKIQFMAIITEDSEISVRELYQALNDNKGRSQVNLISDFIENEDNSLKPVWKKLVNAFKDSGRLLESFIGDFLITRSDDILNKNNLYNNFKNYYYKISKYQDSQTIIDNIYKYSKYYLKIINSDFENPGIKEQIKILNKNNGKDAYPYLMEVLDDVENSHINTDAFLNILIMINSFMKNRQESSISGMNIDFSRLSKELNKMLILKDYTPDFVEDPKLTINEINNLSTFGV